MVTIPVWNGQIIEWGGCIICGLIDDYDESLLCRRCRQARSEDDLLARKLQRYRDLLRYSKPFISGGRKLIDWQKLGYEIDVELHDKGSIMAAERKTP